MYWFISIKRLEKFPQIFYDYESVIISFDKPVELLSVVLVAILERPLSFAPKILPAFTDVQGDSTKLFVLLRAHKDEFITVRSPGVFNMNSPGVMISWTSQNPTQDLHIIIYRSWLEIHRWIFRQYWWKRWRLDSWLP